MRIYRMFKAEIFDLAQGPIELPARQIFNTPGFFMLLLGVANGVLWAVMLSQFVWLLITREPNAYLARFGSSLSIWAADVVRFQTCATDNSCASDNTPDWGLTVQGGELTIAAVGWSSQVDAGCCAGASGQQRMSALRCAP